MKHPQFLNNEVYHIYNRGVDKRDVFQEDIDYVRFIHDLFEFNDENYVTPSNIRLAARTPIKASISALEECLAVKPLNIDKERRGGVGRRRKRKLLVDILAFSLMPNHYHLLVKQRGEKGISRFMHKLGGGYTSYFDLHYDRTGSLFEGTFKAVHVARNAYLEYLLYYIHFNCLDLIEPGWREGMIKDYSRAMKFLERYRWSSHLDYAGKKNFPSVTNREFLQKIIGDEKIYRETVKQWLKEIEKKIPKNERLSALTLE